MKDERTFFIGAIDTETVGLDGRLVMAQIYHETWPDAGLYRTLAPMLVDLFAMETAMLKATIWYVHNMEYDLRYVFEDLARDYKGVFLFDCRQRCPGKFYEIRVLSSTLKDAAGGPLLVTRFRDSTAIYEGKLASFTLEFAPAYAKKDIGLGRGVTFDPDNELHRDYARFDVLGLVNAVKGFDAVIFDHYGVHIKGTGSSTAYEAWRRTLTEDDVFYRQSPEKEAFFRLGYYGGLVQINARFGHVYDAVWGFDINSSYPDAMRKGIPAGNARWTPHYREGLPGFYEVIATVAMDAIMPIIPSRKGNNLAWERGTFRTVISSIEIDYARECGHTIEVLDGFYFPAGLDFRFNAFVDKAEALRAAFKKTPTETVAKRMQNSLYGRFGMKPEGEECMVSFDGCPDGFLPVIDEDTSEDVSNVYWKKGPRDAAYMMPHVSAWITANARISLDRMCTKVGRENVIYRDTDSMHIVGSPDIADTMCGKAYGLLKNEGQKFNIRYHAPKCYTYTDDKGEPKAVYKGIPERLLKPDESDKKNLYRKRIGLLHLGKILDVVFHSSANLKTFWAKRKMFFMRTRSSTRVEKIYSHVIENGVFRPRVSDGVDRNRRIERPVYRGSVPPPMGDGPCDF